MALHGIQAYSDTAAYLAVFQPDISSLSSSEAASFNQAASNRNLARFAGSSQVLSHN